MRHMKTDEAYDEGCEARRRGMAAQSNPYPNLSDYWPYWLAGWEAGDKRSVFRPSRKSAYDIDLDDRQQDNA